MFGMSFNMSLESVLAIAGKGLGSDFRSDDEYLVCEFQTQGFFQSKNECG